MLTNRPGHGTVAGKRLSPHRLTAPA